MGQKVANGGLKDDFASIAKMTVAAPGMAFEEEGWLRREGSTLPMEGVLQKPTLVDERRTCSWNKIMEMGDSCSLLSTTATVTRAQDPLRPELVHAVRDLSCGR
jgi:hypothetical protein